MLAEQRASPPPSFPEEEYKKFARADARVSSAYKTLKNVIPIIQGTIQDEGCVDGPQIPFSNLANMLTGTARKPMPDVWYGARLDQVDSRIRNQDELGKCIVPSITASCPCAPNFFVEAKGPGASTRLVLDQACFDGAAGARGIHKLKTYGQNVPTYDNKAHTLSATYHAGTLKMYAHHPGQPNGPGTEPEYYMNQLRAIAMTDNRETFRQGMTAFRNGVEWAEKQRNAAIEHATAVANGVISPDDDDTDGEGGNNADEDSDEEDKMTATAVDPILRSFTTEALSLPGKPPLGEAGLHVKSQTPPLTSQTAESPSGPSGPSERSTRARRRVTADILVLDRAVQVPRASKFWDGLGKTVHLGTTMAKLLHSSRKVHCLRMRGCSMSMGGRMVAARNGAGCSRQDRRNINEGFCIVLSLEKFHASGFSIKFHRGIFFDNIVSMINQRLFIPETLVFSLAVQLPPVIWEKFTNIVATVSVLSQRTAC